MTAAMKNVPPFQRLLDEHGQDVHRYLRGLVGPSAMDDCFHDALMAALVAYPTLAHSNNLRSWLFTIAHRKGIDILRRSAREIATEYIPETAHTDEPSDADLWSRVASLPTKQRAAVTLRYLGDLAYGDIASILESTEEAARQNVRAGIQSLRKELV